MLLSKSIGQVRHTAMDPPLGDDACSPHIQPTTSQILLILARLLCFPASTNCIRFPPKAPIILNISQQNSSAQLPIRSAVHFPRIGLRSTSSREAQRCLCRGVFLDLFNGHEGPSPLGLGLHVGYGMGRALGMNRHSSLFTCHPSLTSQ